MDLSLLHNASKMTPMLVKLYDSQRLKDMAHDPDARHELVSAVTELLDMDLELREAELVADVLIELMRQAERDLRQAVAEKLAVMEDAPFRLVLHMANDEIDVAAPVLRNSIMLGDLDLIYIVKSKTPDYWREIAKRKTLNDQLINVLAETRDFETGMELADNANITLTDLSLEILSEVAQGKEELAGKLLRRSEMRDDLAQGLYEFVGDTLKSYITQTFSGKDRKLLIQSMDLVLEEKEEEVLRKNENKAAGKLLKKESAREAAERLRDHGGLNMDVVLKTIQDGHLESFISQFACYVGMDDEMMGDMLTRKSGQGLAIICKAHGVMKQDFISMFLLTHELRSEGQTVDTGGMNRAVAYYNKLDEKVAQKILNGAMQ